LTVSASAHFYNLQLQKSPSQVFGQNSGNSADISKAFFEMGIWKFESSQVSQAVRAFEPDHPISRERPAIGGLSCIRESLRVAQWAQRAAQIPKVSG
jgi:hypothetical protein